MPSPSVTVRLSESTYRAIRELAQAEKKNVSELTRELIEKSLGMHQSSEQALLEELRFMSAQVSDLAARAAKAGAGSRYFARLTASYAMDTAQFVASGRPMDEKAREELLESHDRKAKEQEDSYLTRPWEQL